MADAMKLLPCPFCGGEASIERFGTTRVSTQYSCDDCGCFLETGEEFNHGRSWNRRASPPAREEAPAEGAGIDREALIALIMEETTDEIVADGWNRLGKPNVLVQGCRYIRRNAPTGTDGYENPEASAKQFAGFIADRLIVALSARTTEPAARPWIERYMDGGGVVLTGYDINVEDRAEWDLVHLRFVSGDQVVTDRSYRALRPEEGASS